MKGEEGGDKKSHAKITNNNIIGDDCRTVQGTSKAYTVSRLKRDRPDLFEKVVAVGAPEGNQNNKAEKSNVANATSTPPPSQAGYASEIGVSRKTVNDWESDAKILD